MVGAVKCDLSHKGLAGKGKPKFTKDKLSKLERDENPVVKISIAF